MAYADQQMSSNRIIALIIVGLIHLALGYALITGLAYEAVTNVIERVTTVDIEEPPEPEVEDEPPPPPEEVPETVPPPFVPPPQLNIPVERPVQRSTPVIIPDTTVSRRPNKICPDGTEVAASVACGPATKTCPDGKVIPVNATCPPVNRFTPKDPEPRRNPGNWATPNDYPSRALREEREGTTSFRVSVGTNGRVDTCTVTRSSGHSDLDEATCKNIKRRARFRPATNGDGDEVPGTWSNSVRWQIPD